MISTVHYLDALIAVPLLYLVKRVVSNRARPSHPYPPGPQSLPLVGNLLNIPQLPDVWNMFAGLGKKYGPLIHFNIFGQHFLVINSYAHASTLLERQIYSDRPKLIMAGELSGYKHTLSLMQSGPRFRAARRIMHRFIGTRALAAKHGAQIEEEEAQRLMRRILTDPRSENLREHVRKMVGAVILRMTYGYVPQEHDDPLVNLAEETISQFSVIVQPNAFLVDILPALRYLPRWMPGTEFLRYAQSAKENIFALAQRPMDWFHEQLRNGKGHEPISFISANMSAPLSAEDEVFLKWAAVNIYGGGADTSVSMLYAAILALVMHPDVQRKAQEEIDRVIGSDRLPTVADRDSLPYIDAMTKEIFRWNSATPTGGPHRLSEDDIYEGYFIPKGTTVVANIHCMLHDPEVYPDPQRFEPERYLPREGKSLEPNPYSTAFGFGRRVCPGVQLADMSAFIVFATCAAVLDITKAIENGTVIEPMHVTVGATIVHPIDFKCKIVARTEKAASLVISTEQSA